MGFKKQLRRKLQRVLDEFELIKNSRDRSYDDYLQDALSDYPTEADAPRFIVLTLEDMEYFLEEIDKDIDPADKPWREYGKVRSNIIDQIRQARK